MRLLLTCGADIHLVDSSGEDPLQLAHKNRAEESQQIIAEHLG